MSMNGAPSLPEDLNVLKQNILDRFKVEGFSADVEEMRYRWSVAKAEEASRDSTVESRFMAEIEIIEVSSQTGASKEDLTDALYGLGDEASSLGREDLVELIQSKIAELKKPE